MDRCNRFMLYRRKNSDSDQPPTFNINQFEGIGIYWGQISAIKIPKDIKENKNRHTNEQIFQRQK